MKTKWIPNKQYPNTYFAKVNNYEEYFKLAKDLFDEFDITKEWSVDQWEDKQHLFNDNIELWYVFFDAPCLDIDYDNIEDMEDVELIDPKLYDGEIRNKPDEYEYPAVVVFDSDLKNIMWQSMNDLE